MGDPDIVNFCPSERLLYFDQCVLCRNECTEVPIDIAALSDQDGMNDSFNYFRFFGKIADRHSFTFIGIKEMSSWRWAHNEMDYPAKSKQYKKRD